MSPFPLCSVLFQAFMFKCPPFCSLLRIPLDLSNVNSTLLIYTRYKTMYSSPSTQHLIMPTHMAFTGSLLVSFFSIFSLGLFSLYSKIMSHSLLCCLSADNGLLTRVFILSLPLKYFDQHEMLLKAQCQRSSTADVHWSPAFRGPHSFSPPTHHNVESDFTAGLQI